MMKRSWLVLVFVIAWGAGAHAMVRPDGSTGARSGVVHGAVLVQLMPGVEPARGRSADGILVTGMAGVDAVARAVRAERFDRVFAGSKVPPAGSTLRDLTRFYRLEFPDVRDPAEVAAELAKDPSVALAEIITWHAVEDFIPNDNLFSSQWHHQDPSDNDIDTPQGWESQTGDPDVIIAIIDTGVLYSHLDLKENIWINPGENLDGDHIVFDVDDLNGVDDDGNGFIDDLVGWDFVAGIGPCWAGEDCGGVDNDPKDFNGHGTHVAGISAAMTNNSREVSGIAGGKYPYQRGCRIMPLRIGASINDGGVEQGAGQTDWMAAALNYAVANGARVGNLSFGSSPSAAMDAALANAFANGFIFAKAAGNDNSGLPDAYSDYPGVLAVASTTSSDTKSSFSNYGLWISVSAPGSAIMSTVSNHYTPGTAIYSGTSMAAPMVAGMAGLVYSNNPFFTKAQVDSVIINTADNIDAQNPGYVGMLGSGRINVANALNSLPRAAFTADTTTGHVPLTVQFSDLSPGGPSAWTWDFGDGDGSNAQNPLHAYTIPGLYDVRLDATHAAGVGRKRMQHYILAQADTTYGIDGFNCPGKKAVVDLYLRNEIDIYSLILPLKYEGPGNLTLDTVIFTGSRLEYFEKKEAILESDVSKIVIYEFVANNGGGSEPLPPGDGLLLQMKFTIGNGVPTDTLSPVDTFSALGYSYSASTVLGVKYVPAFRVSGVDILCYCRGDFNLSCSATSSDIISLVNYVFKGGTPSPDPWTMDVNTDGSVTSSDIIFLVNFVFKGGPAPQ